jgi:hypothetical protein
LAGQSNGTGQGDKYLSVNRFLSLAGAQYKIEAWKRYYNLFSPYVLCII